jgi:cytochrome b6-f complex iron-sulfur subunit
MATMSEPKESSNLPSAFTSRRSFIHLAAASIGAAWAGVFVQKQIFPSASASSSLEPVEFPLSELPVGGSRPFTYGGVPGIAIRTPESIKAFSLICTHLGCHVQWRSAAREFYCPCHEGRFDAFGEVMSGPPPVPLEGFPVKIDSDRVIIGEGQA